MKTIIALFLLLPFTAFGQVTESNGVCSTPATGGTLEWGCAFIPDILPPPPPVPTGFTSLNCIGDSWTDQSRNGEPSWCDMLGGNTGTPTDNKAVSGATTGQMDSQAQQEVSEGIDPTGLYTWWSFPNDLVGLTDFSQLPPIIQGIEDNATATFSRFEAAGVVNMVIFTTPNFNRIPFTNQPGANVVSDMINTAIRNAAASVGWSDKVYDTDPFFLTVDIDNDWLSDGRHFNQATNARFAQLVEEDFF